RNDSTLGEREIRDVFVKIPERSSLYAQAALAEIDGVHVCFQDIILAHLFLNLQCKIHFLQLSLYFVIKCIFIYEIRKYIILDQLLGDRAGSFREGSACNAHDPGSDDSLKVNTFVLIETLVL